MIGNGIALVIVTTVLTAAQAAPERNRRSTAVPPWHRPCGTHIDVITTPVEDFEAEVTEALGSISLQHQLTMNNYLMSDYEYLYEDARLGVHKHQYVPNWLPRKRDVGTLKRLKKSNVVTIANHLPRLHTDLQKFLVAFEELVEDAQEDNLRRILKGTQGFLLMTLCEVESALSTIPPLQVPQRISRSIMSETERNPVDDTRRLVRDWGVILKYKDFLHAWRHVFGY